MILLHRKVLPRPGSPTRMMISFCRSTRLRFRTFWGACLRGRAPVSVLRRLCQCKGGRRNVGMGGCQCAELTLPLQGQQKACGGGKLSVH